MDERRCALCRRAATHLTRHHLIPRTVHRRPRTRRKFTRDERLKVVLLCRACHKQSPQLIYRVRARAHLLLDRSACWAP